VLAQVAALRKKDVKKLFAAVWPKLQRTLRSRQSVDLFIALLTSQCEAAELTVHEIPVITPDTATFDPPSSDECSTVEPEFCFSLTSGT
jgi:hypothetical protein